MVQTMVAGLSGMLLAFIWFWCSALVSQCGQWKRLLKIMEVVFLYRATDYFSHACSGLFRVILPIFVYVVGWVAVWIFRADIPVVKFSPPNSPNYPAPSEAISLNTVFFIILGVFVCALCLLRLHSSTTWRFRKISPLMLVLFGFLRVSTLGVPVMSSYWRSVSYIPFISIYAFPYHQWLCNWSWTWASLRLRSSYHREQFSSLESLRA